jgi:hypothetical protein
VFAARMADGLAAIPSKPPDGGVGSWGKITYRSMTFLHGKK